MGFGESRGAPGSPAAELEDTHWMYFLVSWMFLFSSRIPKILQILLAANPLSSSLTAPHIKTKTSPGSPLEKKKLME